MKQGFYIGVATCCGAITAAMVADAHTKFSEVGRFAADIATSGREFKLIEINKGETLNMSRCKCGAVNRYL